MNCTRCNTELKFDARVCPGCGAPILEIIKEAKQKEESNQPSQKEETDIKRQKEYDDNPRPSRIEYLQSIDMPMKYYKFLIYFWLFFEAILCTISGFFGITGGLYNIALGMGTAAKVYDEYPKLQILDISIGCLSILSAIFCIIVRQKLKQYSRQAPFLFICSIIIISALDIVYNSICNDIIGIKQALTMDLRTLIKILFTLLWIMINRTYFSKRFHLFRK